MKELYFQYPISDRLPCNRRRCRRWIGWPHSFQYPISDRLPCNLLSALAKAPAKILSVSYLGSSTLQPRGDGTSTRQTSTFSILCRIVYPATLREARPSGPEPDFQYPISDRLPCNWLSGVHSAPGTTLSVSYLGSSTLQPPPACRPDLRAKQGFWPPKGLGTALGGSGEPLSPRVFLSIVLLPRNKVFASKRWVFAKGQRPQKVPFPSKWRKIAPSCAQRRGYITDLRGLPVRPRLDSRQAVLVCSRRDACIAERAASVAFLCPPWVYLLLYHAHSLIPFVDEPLA
jgi:hypothetical protein